MPSEASAFVSAASNTGPAATAAAVGECTFGTRRSFRTDGDANPLRRAAPASLENLIFPVFQS
jgi:hypothetical protein